MKRIAGAFTGDRLTARVLRSASWLMVGYGGSQALRLVANLILTRILFPEAFGLMALISVITIGLSMFSDVGIGPSVAQSKRGDDPEFLDTAWTIQVIRGTGLWLTACALALPASWFYDQPMLALYLPLGGLSLLIEGFNPTRIETAHRHLLVGRLTLVDLASQAIGLCLMVALALATRSVAALVVGSVAQAVLYLVATNVLMPGHRNRFRWEKEAAAELVTFGKWIFLSTAFWFVSSQGDRAILGKFLTLEWLGLYNIGYFLATFSLMLGHAVTQRIMIPVYRDKPAAAAAENLRRQRQLRTGLTLTIGGLVAVMALIGPALVEVLYDHRYVHSGAIVTLMSVALMPAVLGMTYDQAALAAGDSRSFFVYSACRAVAQVLLLIVGIRAFGLVGAIAAVGLTQIAVYPVLAWLARRHRVWDPLHDAAGFAGFALIAWLALTLHTGSINALLAASAR